MNNPVAKYAHKFNKSAKFRDRTKYSRKKEKALFRKLFRAF